MIIIEVASKVYDSDGARFLKQDAGQEIENNKGARRVTRTATLDGGAVADDSGYSAADRTYIVKTKDETGEIAAWAERMVKTYSTVTLSTRFGCFTGTPSQWFVRQNFVYIEILIIEQIDE